MLWVNGCSFKEARENFIRHHASAFRQAETAFLLGEKLSGFKFKYQCAPALVLGGCHFSQRYSAVQPQPKEDLFFPHFPVSDRLLGHARRCEVAVEIIRGRKSK